MGVKFTWQEKFTRQLEQVPDEVLPQLVRAIVAYGTDGVEPDLPWPLSAIFEGMREDIDYSHGVREGGRRGGRAKAAPKPSGCAREALQATRDAAQEACKPSEAARDAAQEACKPSEAKGDACEEACDTREPIALHSIALHSTAERGGESAPAPGADPPEPGEVLEYALASTLPPFDEEEFCAYYAARGWRDSHGRPFADWRPLAVSWAKRQGRMDAERRGRQRRAGAGEVSGRDLSYLDAGVERA